MYFCIKPNIFFVYRMCKSRTEQNTSQSTNITIDYHQKAYINIVFVIILFTLACSFCTRVLCFCWVSWYCWIFLLKLAFSSLRRRLRSEFCCKRSWDCEGASSIADPSAPFSKRKADSNWKEVGDNQKVWSRHST